MNKYSISCDLAAFTQKAFPEAVELNEISAKILPFLEKLETANKEPLKDAIIAIMAASPRVTCESFHHEKKDRHANDEACPCVLRWELALKDAGELL